MSASSLSALQDEGGSPSSDVSISNEEDNVVRKRILAVFKQDPAEKSINEITQKILNQNDADVLEDADKRLKFMRMQQCVRRTLSRMLKNIERLKISPSPIQKEKSPGNKFHVYKLDMNWEGDWEVLRGAPKKVSKDAATPSEDTRKRKRDDISDSVSTVIAEQPHRPPPTPPEAPRLSPQRTDTCSSAADNDTESTMKPTETTISTTDDSTIAHVHATALTEASQEAGPSNCIGLESPEVANNQHLAQVQETPMHEVLQNFISFPTPPTQDAYLDTQPFLAFANDTTSTNANLNSIFAHHQLLETQISHAGNSMGSQDMFYGLTSLLLNQYTRDKAELERFKADRLYIEKLERKVLAMAKEIKRLRELTKQVNVDKQVDTSIVSPSIIDAFSEVISALREENKRLRESQKPAKTMDTPSEVIAALREENKKLRELRKRMNTVDTSSEVISALREENQRLREWRKFLNADEEMQMSIVKPGKTASSEVDRCSADNSPPKAASDTTPSSSVTKANDGESPLVKPVSGNPDGLHVGVHTSPADASTTESSSYLPVEVSEPPVIKQEVDDYNQFQPTKYPIEQIRGP